MKKVRTSSGITLVEFLTAFFVLLVTVGGVVTGYIRALELAETSANISRAVQAAQTRMETIRSADYDTIFSDFHNAGFTVGELTGGQGISTVDNTSPELLDIEVIVGWTQKNGRVFTLADSPARVRTRLFRR